MASANGKAIRERTVRQETMTDSGTMPESCYHLEFKSSDVNKDGKANSDDPGDGKIYNEGDDKIYNEGKFEHSTEGSQDNDNEEVEIAKKKMFLISTTSMFSRAVKLLSKLLKLLSKNKTKLRFEKKKAIHFFTKCICKFFYSHYASLLEFRFNYF